MSGARPQPGSGSPLPEGYLATLIALVVVGVLVSGWLLHYTEWFGVVGGLLGLGGLFAWIAFVSGLLRGERKTQMQELFETRVLLWRGTRWGCAGALALLAALTLCSGTLFLDAQAEPDDRIVTVTGVDGERVATLRVPGRGTRKLWLLSSPWGRALRVKVGGLPGARAELQPPFRLRLSVPGGFVARPRLLVRPAPVLSGVLARAPEDHELRVRLGTHEAVLTPYAGRSVWIGCEADVPVPADSLRRWREELSLAAVVEAGPGGEALSALLAAHDAVLARWQAPLSALEDVEVEPEQELHLVLHRRSDGATIAESTADVQPAGWSGAVQEVELR